MELKTTYREAGIADAPVGTTADDIRRTLVKRRRELLTEIQNRVRDVRDYSRDVTFDNADSADAVEAEPEDDVAFALIQMKAETLERVDEAVRHFDEGTYGHCVDCGEPIAPARLRALPFAVRCRTCEEIREKEQHRARVPVRPWPTRGSRLTA